MSKSSPRRRVLLVSPMPPAMGGISVSTARLRDRLVADGYDVDTYNLQMNVLPGCHALWQLINTLYLPFFVISKRKYDIIHLHISGYWRRVYLKMIIGLFKGAKTVVTIHGDVDYYLNRPFSNFFLDAGDRIICVRPGNKKSLPDNLQKRASEIPAFIMPPQSDIDKLTLPDEVKAFIDKTKANHMPLLVFNGAIVLGKPFYDLYGFEDMVALSDYLSEKSKKAGIMMIVNDMNLSDDKAAFLKKIEEKLSGNDNVFIVKSLRFSLLPVFDSGGVIYVRPTKTDGDSLSVREALALGVPVIASGNTPRPEGTLCYDPGECPLAFCQTVDAAIDSQTSALDKKDRRFNDFYDKIIEVYDSLLS